MGTGTTDEAATWIRAAAGDDAAFGVMFDTHRDRVFGQALRVLRSPHDAEDATALVFLEAWRRRDTVRVVDGSIVGWLLVTTNFVCSNLVRSARRYRAVIDILPPPAPQADHSEEVDAHLDGRERRDRVRSAFAALSTNDQNVITLCVIEELSTQQAADALGVPIGTVKSRLSRAKRRLANTSGGAL